MSTSTLEELARLVSSGTRPVTSAQLPGFGTGPRVDVDDFGEIQAPLGAAALRRLLRLAEPAAYGQGEQTHIDPAVRDTWQIPAPMVTVDWDGALKDVLESARQVLGLPPTCRLRGEFHSLLVYEPGQFFVAHQDSQKDDDMVATLVVTLPSPGTGGELLVHDGDATSTYRASREEASLVVFYADRLHEVRPVRSGHRVTMTYNLLVDGDTLDRAVPVDLVAEVADTLGGHFSTPYSRYGEEPHTPTRLAYLLDHEYPARGLRLGRLKGADAPAAALLTAAAERAGCEVVLALTEIHEIRDGEEEDGELIDEEVEVTHWVTPDGDVETASLGLGEEVAAGVPSFRMRPHASEFEGYVGNYGNTTDRWYRRAALLVWPRRLAFANRAEASPTAAMRQVLSRLAEGADTGVETDLAGLAPSWTHIVRAHRLDPHASARTVTGLLEPTLAVAGRVGDGELARTLLDPFAIEDVNPGAAEHLIALADRRGADWVRALLQAWCSEGPAFAWRRVGGAWVLGLPDLVRALADRPALGRELLTLAWGHLRRRFEATLAAPPTASARLHLEELGEPLAALLEAIAELDEEELQAQVLAWCRRADLVEALLEALRVARAWPERLRAASDVRAVAEFSAAALRDRLAAPVREAGDWSIAAPPGCGCDLCDTLAKFLTDATERELEWPLAAQGRRHLHDRIDRAELPVSHVTRRQGRPYTLVLTKTRDLFDREHRERDEAHRRLDELRRDWDLA